MFIYPLAGVPNQTEPNNTKSILLSLLLLFQLHARSVFGCNCNFVTDSIPVKQDIQVEAGPQDGTLLVTWLPVIRPPSSGPVTGYAVYADGKKVTDVDSPTGDHALIDIGKLVGLNPRAITLRTKSRDSQSADSQPTAIPSKLICYNFQLQDSILCMFRFSHV